MRLNQSSGLVTVNEEFTLRLTTVPCINTKEVGYRWACRPASSMNTDITVVARMVPANDSVLDYFAVPRTDGWTSQVTVGPEDDMVSSIYRFDDISFLAGC